jgi:secreted trypsin-like serine protease
VDKTFTLSNDAAFGGGSKRGACSGDSGGPVFDTGIMSFGVLSLVAIVTRSSGGAGRCGTNAVFELIEPHRAWISDTAQRLGSQLGP